MDSEKVNIKTNILVKCQMSTFGYMGSYRRCLETESDGADVMLDGSAFHRLPLETGNASSVLPVNFPCSCFIFHLPQLCSVVGDGDAEAGNTD